jgi:ABC-type Co2+ transport system permease subunit
MEVRSQKKSRARIETMNPTSEVLNRVIKYLVEGLFVAMAAIFIPRHRLPMDEILTLGVVAAAIFAILDVVSPSIGATARQGAGFGIGANLVGFPGARL